MTRNPFCSLKFWFFPSGHVENIHICWQRWWLEDNLWSYLPLKVSNAQWNLVIWRNFKISSIWFVPIVFQSQSDPRFFRYIFGRELQPSLTAHQLQVGWLSGSTGSASSSSSQPFKINGISISHHVAIAMVDVGVLQLHKLIDTNAGCKHWKTTCEKKKSHVDVRVLRAVSEQI